MEPTSSPLHKGQVSWRGLLLTVSLLTCWNSPTPAKVTVEQVLPQVAAWKNVLLCVHNQPATVLVSYCTAMIPKTKNIYTWEGSLVALMCEPKTQNTTYLWRINDQSLSEEDRLKLSEDNRTFTLLSVVRTDTGSYECETRNPVSASPSDLFSLNITC
ncbi:cell adhesion molecule CEACAM1-like [Peromyscus maniculatus bairdii]|uniref:cell adhesion molecule CEACAM1-like n=1 Tax=Peromyscus maniculatus bairdii TaxID=230844 RepID=UPI003FD3C7C4